VEAADRYLTVEEGVLQRRPTASLSTRSSTAVLAPPKSGSVGGRRPGRHSGRSVRGSHPGTPPIAVDLAEITRGTPNSGKTPTLRVARLFFTDERGRPIHDQAWARLWKMWREAAGWPAEGTFHSLRHYFRHVADRVGC
jgi:hypothetical protein